MKHLLLLLLLLPGISWAQNKVETFAHAIAKTEGFYVRGSIPNRLHNPGDLKIIAKGNVYPGQVGVGKGGHVRFRNDAAGYAALYHQIDKMLEGKSRFYRQEMNLWQVGRLYAQNSRLWAKNMGKNLGVSPSTTLEEYFELPPRFIIKGEICPIL